MGVLCWPVEIVEVVLRTKASQCWFGKMSDQQRVITSSTYRMLFVDIVE